MENVFEFLSMGGYAAYVWSSFGATMFLLIVLLASSMRKLKVNERELNKLQALGPKNPRRKKSPRKVEALP